METRLVGSSGLRVSRLGLGTMTWGRDTPPEQARGLLQMFCEAGGTLIDTAAAYGAGDAERIVGRLVKHLGNRDEMVIATKAGFVIRNGERIVDTSRRALLRDLEGSLDRLGTDYVDLWQIHAFGAAPLAETLEAVDHAVRTGRARYAGVSNFVGWQTAQAATWQCAFPGRTPIASAQVEYSLLARRAEVEVLPAAPRLRDGPVPLVPVGARRAYRPVPQRHPARVAGRIGPLRVVRRAVPGAPQPRSGRGGRQGGRRAGPDPAPGSPALGPGRPRGHRSPAGRPYAGPARAGAGGGRPAATERDRPGPGRRVGRAQHRTRRRRLTAGSAVA